MTESINPHLNPQFSEREPNNSSGTPSGAQPYTETEIQGANTEIQSKLATVLAEGRKLTTEEKKLYDQSLTYELSKVGENYIQLKALTQAGKQLPKEERIEALMPALAERQIVFDALGKLFLQSLVERGFSTQPNSFKEQLEYQLGLRDFMMETLIKKVDTDNIFVKDFLYDFVKTGIAEQLTVKAPHASQVIRQLNLEVTGRASDGEIPELARIPEEELIQLYKVWISFASIGKQIKSLIVPEPLEETDYRIWIKEKDAILVTTLGNEWIQLLQADENGDNYSRSVATRDEIIGSHHYLFSGWRGLTQVRNYLSGLGVDVEEIDRQELEKAKTEIRADGGNI